ncbi:DNA repair protein RadA/Sms [Pontimonas salivibrio]|uniref:DNA repair protein RadA n=1 Tax=Pontimonas salivibrio TaxID=1159327 RepID=A0A2L2BN14_9MICO|nr:DNA repair protein RadA [Pontimonas salivibrio]AVG23037.1 DNA repair protein RadA/Sms [Pontimonas salivibrio]
MPKTAAAYKCDECGWTTLKWVGRCGECQSWGTVVEAGTKANRPRVEAAIVGEDNRAKPITEHSAEHTRHEPTGIGEFDRVLGGGIVPGAAILLSGEPGVGKSTLLLDVAARVAATGRNALYVSAEESVGQVRLRAQRTGALLDSLYLASTTDLATVLGQVEQLRPSLLIVDSVQTIQADNVDSLPGGPAQVREVASSLIRLAKSENIPVILVGHVTKDGQVAGPRTLEHLVDVVCHFEGDRQTALRFVRALKNRFGPTDEVGCFEMSGDGIQEVPDPSALFRSGSGQEASGTCTTIALEGRRALPVEIQALVVPTTAPQPRRVVNGVDSSRVAMVLAVLERRAGLKLSQADVYISTVGGIRLTEPAADLAIALAVASAIKDVALPSTLAAVGEISLSGEIRAVTSGDQRQSEGKRLGFNTTLDRRSGSIRQAITEAFGTTQGKKAPF